MRAARIGRGPAALRPLGQPDHGYQQQEQHRRAEEDIVRGARERLLIEKCGHMLRAQPETPAGPADIARRLLIGTLFRASISSEIAAISMRYFNGIATSCTGVTLAINPSQGKRSHLRSLSNR
ncbi:hypothetical protein D3C71_1795640 [compost metagenome]